jgi:Fungal specific transcription factor domain
MYPVWPVVNAEEVIARLGPEMQDPEVRALAFSVCAATGAQLRLDDFDVKRDQNSIIDRFAGEAERYRIVSDARENATVNVILIPFFLSMYYSSRRKRFTATLLLREALTLCELLDLDKESVYATLDVDEQKWRRKVFWLLFITERGTAMQYDMATILRNTVAMPREEDDKDPVIFKAFLSLVHLFVAVEGTLIEGGQRGESGPASTPELFAEMQEKLRSELNLPANSNEVQRTDITVTQQWSA